MPVLITDRLDTDERDRRVVEILTSLARYAETREIQGLVVLTIMPDPFGRIEENLRSVFDVIEHEESIAVLERWCKEARDLIRLTKEDPGGSA
jgi:hypothetical protein